MFSFIAHMDGCVWVVIANENVIGSCKGHKILHAPRQSVDSKIMLHLSEGLSIFFPGYEEGLERPMVPPVCSENMWTDIW